MVMVTEESIFSLFFLEGQFFANNVMLNGFEHMQGLLDGECIATELPCGILLWHTDKPVTMYSKHTLTIHLKSGTRQIYGNCIFTSDDDESLSGVRSLSDIQMKWLSTHHDLINSTTSNDLIIEFFANN